LANSDEPFLRAEELPEDFLSEIDKELDFLDAPPMAIEVVADPDAFNFEGLEVADSGISEMQQTFLAIARNSLGPVSRYMKALSDLESFEELLEICELIVTPLISKTEQVGLNEHADDLQFFRSLLVLALGERDPVGRVAIREVVVEGFSRLHGRFELNYRGYRLAVRNLVQFYRNMKSSEGIHEVDIRKFFAIGVPSLTWIRKTKTEDLVSLSGVPNDIVREIRKLASAYRSLVPVSSAHLDKAEYPPKPTAEDFSNELLREEELELEVGGVDVMDSEVMIDPAKKAGPRGHA
jgi:hypothetical protein